VNEIRREPIYVAKDVPTLDGTVVLIPRGKTVVRRDGRWEFTGSRVWVDDIMEHWLPVTVLHEPAE
jgi:hypothetical protein